MQTVFSFNVLGVFENHTSFWTQNVEHYPHLFYYQLLSAPKALSFKAAEA
jgi:hypothetical protein